MKLKRTRINLALMALLYLLSGCSSPVRTADTYADQQDWMKAVLTYRKALSKDPDDIEIKSRLKQAELKAADFYYQRGAKLVDQGNLDGAAVEFQQGLAAMPDHAKLVQAMNHVLARKEAMTSFSEGVRLKAVGRYKEARAHLEHALTIHPEFREAQSALDEVNDLEKKEKGNRLVLSSKAPITLNFRNTGLRSSFEFVAKSFGINVIFDEAAGDTPVTLFARDVTFEQALNLMLATTKTFYKRVGPNTILVVPDTEAKRGQYEDHIIRTFQLNSVTAKDMLDILKGVVKIKKAIINEQLNTLTLRDTQDVLALSEQLIEINDRKPAEIVVDVEILEVNRTKTELLGLDWGSKISAAFPQFTISTGSVSSSVNNGVVTLPGIAFNYFKQDVDAKTLANPKVRVINRKAARIHIGDRVPLRASTIQDATGQTRTTFDYKEIGIKLNVDPIIHLDNSVTVKLGLEVSALGQNVGTITEPAYSIGTRNAETVMLLRDGETAILGGLIRDEERDSRVSVPGLGDTPALGMLFSNKDSNDTRTDVLLTITPRVVRAWDVPSKKSRTMYSGTQDSYGTKPVFAYLENAAEGGARSQISVGRPATAVAAGGGAVAGATPASVVPGGPVPGGLAQAAANAPMLAFAQPVYEARADQAFEVVLTGEHLAGVNKVPIEILFNPQLLTFVDAKTGSAAKSIRVDTKNGPGKARLELELNAQDSATGPSELARLTLRGSRQGISYLIYRAPTLATRSGGTVAAQVRASRVLVK